MSRRRFSTTLISISISISFVPYISLTNTVPCAQGAHPAPERPIVWFLSLPYHDKPPPFLDLPDLTLAMVVPYLEKLFFPAWMSSLAQKKKEDSGSLANVLSM